jgi:glucokinase
VGIVCAVDLGGTNLRAANIDQQGRILERFKTPSPKSDNHDDFVAAIAEAVTNCDASRTLQAVSIVVPGSVQVETGVVVNAPNISSLQGYALAPALESAIGRRVLLENDANAAALGEMWQGAARGCQTVICLTLGTGVGGGIILDGKLWRGIDGTAGEIGHTSVEPFGGVKCKCGNNGCLEVYASGTAIVRMAREALNEEHDSPLSAGEFTAADVFKAAVAGDELSIKIFGRVGTYLGVAMANLVNIFNPEMIVVSGGVSAAWNLFADRARAEIILRAFPVPAQRCRIARAEHIDDAGLLGAAWLGFDF